MTSAEFVELCRSLRELGATAVEAEGYKATFPAAMRVVTPVAVDKADDPFTALEGRFATAIRDGEEQKDPVQERRNERRKILEALSG